MDFNTSAMKLIEDEDGEDKDDEDDDDDKDDEDDDDDKTFPWYGKTQRDWWPPTTSNALFVVVGNVKIELIYRIDSWLCCFTWVCDNGPVGIA